MIPVPGHSRSLGSALRRWYAAWKALASKAIDGNELEAQLELVTAKHGCLPPPQKRGMFAFRHQVTTAAPRIA